MNRQETAKCIQDFIDHFEELGFHDYYKTALEMARDALQTPHQKGSKTHIKEHDHQEQVLDRVDNPPGFDSVRANQCVICAREMPEGDQVCRRCRRTAYPPKPNSGLLEED